MIIARYDQGGTRTVGIVTWLDQPSTTSSSATLHSVGRDKVVVDLDDCQYGDQLGAAAQNADEGSRWLLLDTHTPPAG